MRAVASAGGAPFALQGEQELAHAAGLVLSGGGDVAPWRYGGPPHPSLGGIVEARDELELAVASEAARRRMPILAICRGLQVLVVACGGTLWQDLPSQLPHGLDHGRGARRSRAQPGATGAPVAPASEPARHLVLLQSGSLAAAAACAAELEVNSSHHQAAQTVGSRLAAGARLAVSGWAPDGVIEAVEMPGAPFVLGVQWHPEEMLDRAEHAQVAVGARLFSALVAAAAR